MKRLIIAASILFTGCAPTHYMGYVTSIDPYNMKVTVDISPTNCKGDITRALVEANAEEKDTLEKGDLVRILIDGLKIVK